MPIPPGEFSVGREDDTYIHLEDGSVSRRHAIIFNQADGLFVEDKGSSNGTSVRGVLVTSRTKIEIGDLVRFGSISFRVDPEVGEARTIPLPAIPIPTTTLPSSTSSSQPLSSTVPISIMPPAPQTPRAVRRSQPLPASEPLFDFADAPPKPKAEPAPPTPLAEKPVEATAAPEETVPAPAIPKVAIPDIILPQSTITVPSTPKPEFSKPVSPLPMTPETIRPKSNVPEPPAPKSVSAAASAGKKAVVPPKRVVEPVGLDPSPGPSVRTPAPPLNLVFQTRSDPVPKPSGTSEPEIPDTLALPHYPAPEPEPESMPSSLLDQSESVPASSGQPEPATPTLAKVDPKQQAKPGTKPDAAKPQGKPKLAAAPAGPKTSPPGPVWVWWVVVFLAGVGVGLLLGLTYASMFSSTHTGP